MKEKRFTLMSEDDIELYAVQWSPSGVLKTRGVVQIIHGMAEHKERYRDLAEVLTGEGFTVYIHDVRGHGESAGSLDRVGFFAESDGWMKALDDARRLGTRAREENPDLPFFLLGHSMGSLMARTYAILYDEDPLNGLVLSGTSAGKGALEDIGLFIAGLQKVFKGSRFPSKIHNNLTFGAFNKPFEPGRTAFDWLNRDEALVDAYIDDPYCGGVFSCSFYRDLIRGVKYVSNPENIAKTMKNLPIYLVSGGNDPVGDNGEGVKKVAEGYQAAGCSDLTVKIYPEGRHEILNETNRDEVRADLLGWMKARLT